MKPENCAHSVEIFCLIPLSAHSQIMIIQTTLWTQSVYIYKYIVCLESKFNNICGMKFHVEA